MADEQQDEATDPAPSTDYCTSTPVPGTYLTAALLGSPCADCGHATLLHVGVTHCPVCELVDHNANARATAVAATVAAEPQSLAERAWAAVQARHERARPAAMDQAGP